VPSRATVRLVRGWLPRVMHSGPLKSALDSTCLHVGTISWPPSWRFTISFERSLFIYLYLLLATTAGRFSSRNPSDVYRLDNQGLFSGRVVVYSIIHSPIACRRLLASSSGAESCVGPCDRPILFVDSSHFELNRGLLGVAFHLVMYRKAFRQKCAEHCWSSHAKD
jgi:hypothetical protein